MILCAQTALATTLKEPVLKKYIPVFIMLTDVADTKFFPRIDIAQRIKFDGTIQAAFLEVWSAICKVILRFTNCAVRGHTMIEETGCDVGGPAKHFRFVAFSVFPYAEDVAGISSEDGTNNFWCVEICFQDGRCTYGAQKSEHFELRCQDVRFVANIRKFVVLKRKEVGPAAESIRNLAHERNQKELGSVYLEFVKYKRRTVVDTGPNAIQILG